MHSLSASTSTQKYKPACQLTQLVKGSDSKQILSYSNSFNNNILVSSTHIEFNNGHIIHDRNSLAYAVYYTADNRYACIFVKNSFALQLLNLSTGDMMVARGLDDLQNYTVISISLQRQEQIKTGQQSRRIYMILQYKGSTFIKVIQIQPKIDNNPKTRQKPMEQKWQARNISLIKPFFSSNRWNVFICCLKQCIEVCRPRNKNDEIQVEFSTQNLEQKLANLYTSNCVLAMAESTKTWALLCGNRINSREESNLALNIFWQHFFPNELAKNMYCRDDAFLKTVVLPCPQRQFIRMWQYSQFYAIQTKGKQFGSHRCYIISECNLLQSFNTDLFALNLSQNSTVCQLSISATQAEVSICEIVNKIQLNRIRYCLKQQGITQTTAGHSVPNNVVSQNKGIPNNQSPLTQAQSQSQSINSNKGMFPTHTTADTPQGTNNQQTNKQDKEKIKKFQPIPEPAIQNPQAQQGKLTVRRHETLPENKQVEQTKNLINARLMEHLQKAENNSNQSESVEVPTSVQRLVSFGVAGQIKNKPKQQIPSAVLVSFGPGARPPLNVTKQQKSPATEKKEANKQKQKQVLSASRIKQSRQIFNSLINKITEELKQRQQSFKDNYESLTINDEIKLENVFTQRQQSRLKNFHKLISEKNATIKRQQQSEERRLIQNVNKLNKIRLKLQKFVTKLQINAYDHVQQLKLIRKINKKPKIKQLSDIVQESINEANQKIRLIELLVEQKNAKYLQQPPLHLKTKTQPRQKATTKQIFKLLSHQQRKISNNQKTRKIPIFRQIHYYKSEPLHKLIPL